MEINIINGKNIFRIVVGITIPGINTTLKTRSRSIFVASVVLLSLFVSVNPTSAEAMLWDTMVKETDCSKLPGNYSDPGCWSYELTSSKSWKNKANWTPAGQPGYTFIGNALVETDTYYYLFHTGMGDGPFYWQKYPSGVLQGKHYGAEQYGTATGMGTPKKVSNYHLNSVQIIKNIDSEIVLKVDAGGWGSGFILNENVVLYTFKNDLFEITPANNYTYSSALHSATARIVVLVANDEFGNDTFVDIQYDSTGKDLESFYPPSSNKRFMLQLSTMKGNDSKYNVMYMAIPKDYSSAKTYISGGIRRGFSIIEIFGGYDISKSKNNSAMYFSNIPYENVWKLYEPNITIYAGETYATPFITTIPGKYKMMGLVLSAEKKIYITKDVSDGNFVFTSPIEGKLLDIVIYLYDRMDSTPVNIITPMDVYRKSISKLSTVSTPAFSPSAGAYSSDQTVNITTATAGAMIRYTTDGSTPTETSTVYSTPTGININLTTTLKAKAWMSNMTPSRIATATYTIYTPIISSITVSPAQASMIVNSTRVFVSNPKDQWGKPMTATVAWTSSNESAGTITPDGFFTALAQGTATITATSETVTGMANVTITAVPKQYLKVTFPNGEESWTRGTTQTIRWNSTGSIGSYVKIELLKPGVANKVIIASTLNDGSHLWLIPATLSPGNYYKVKITSTANPTYNDTSDDNFTIPAPLFTVISPNGTESWIRGTTQTIRWNSSGIPGTYVKIELLKGGVLNRVIIANTLNDGSNQWLIPPTQAPGTDYNVRITSTTNVAYNDTSDNALTIPAPSFSVVSPNGSDSWIRGTTKTIRWNSTESPGSYVKIELLKPGVAKKVIIASTINDGSHTWLIPAAQMPGTDYKVKITSTVNVSINDTSDNPFTIPAPSFTVLSPNGSQNWTRGTTQTIRWNSTESPGTYVKIELLKPGLANKVIIFSTLNDGSHPWLIPATQTPGADYKIKVSSTANVSNNDTSDNNFSIVPPKITVTSPDGDENWTRGTAHAITWNYTGNPGTYVKIELLKNGMVNRTILASTPNDKSQSWIIPTGQAIGTDYKIRIISTTNAAYNDTSDRNFTISS